MVSDEELVKECNQPPPSPFPCHIITGDGGAGVTLQVVATPGYIILVDIYPFPIDHPIPMVDYIGLVVLRLWRHRSGGGISNESGVYPVMVGRGKLKSYPG